VPARMKAEGRLLIILAFGLLGFAAYFAVGVARGRLSAAHLVIAVLSLLVAGVTIGSQLRGPVLLRATADRLVVSDASRTVYLWSDVTNVALSTRDGRPALAVMLAGASEPALVSLAESALSPLEVLHGLRQVAPGHVGTQLS